MQTEKTSQIYWGSGVEPRRGTRLLKDLVDAGQSKEWLELNWDFFIGGKNNSWDIFTGYSRDEICFWIGFSGRKLGIKDLGLIRVQFDDLFHMGLVREDLDLEGIDEVVKHLEFEIKQLSELETYEVIQRPTGSTSLFGSVVEIDRDGWKSSAVFPDSPIRVYHSDGSMKKVDFIVRKEILGKRLEALRKLM
jgi:hypothetical protein